MRSLSNIITCVTLCFSQKKRDDQDDDALTRVVASMSRPKAAGKASAGAPSKVSGGVVGFRFSISF